MLVTIGDDKVDIRARDEHRRKFGSAMAEYLHAVSLQGGADEETGDVESPIGYVCRLGKWLLIESGYGHVLAWKARSVDVAEGKFAAYARQYDDWSNGDWDNGEWPS